MVITTQALSEGPAQLWADILHPQAIFALRLTLAAVLITTLVNGIFGTLSAMVLVRYQFPGRSFLNAPVDLPFAIPTLVAGLMIAALYGATSPLGAWLQSAGIEVLYNLPGIVLAMLFVTMPLAIRALQPV